ncbi:S8 family serine peptidase [Streptomyces sp. NBC_01217]|uniref:S8 family serine peptidase n=1 Tax=Streptomyces sp. NBC_01217 TaxID=2903779 RepID=UPI002E10E84D|nr:S8 family serine peptidase [Streptomyces sp. NBC_01217]
MGWPIRLTAAISTMGVLAAAAVLPASAQPQAGNESGARSDGAPPTTVRLITGDRVTVAAAAGGKNVASVQPGPGREGIIFHTVEQDGDLMVLPSDAVGPVSTGTVDQKLFNVSELIAQGFDEAHTDSLPLIVSQAEGTSTAAVDALSALRKTSAPSYELRSIDARSLRVDASDLSRLWRQLAPTSGKLDEARIAATPKVWLDGKVEASLDRSTAQINAPAAWKAGFDGHGVKVAVLDTGVDDGHPDLAGRITDAKDFSGGTTGTRDAFGHGTHVAATVGGSGAGSGGSRRGVAPASDLLIGKVLGDDGSGSESSVIAGMEWAAAEGAKVISMSLGADIETDGTDPMSLAVNRITDSSGALFVVAAGNNGEAGLETVGSPGAADAALTVGAVDRKDVLAPFSSRGPRSGDGAVKPDVTAPGVGIVAARAAGTTMGDPVDDLYTSVSGTSMATPHVAGAAALLAQQHPGWHAKEIKDALVSTAHTVSGTKVTEQGGGRIDLAAAVLGQVTATGTVALGPFQSGTTAKNAEGGTVRYTNTSDKPVTLELAVQLATDGGRAVPDGTVEPGSKTLDIAPGATAEVPLNVDPSLAGRGKYYGYVSASTPDGQTVAHTTVSLVVHAPMHTLSVDTIDRGGEHIDAAPMIWGPDGFVRYTSFAPVTAEVEEGAYQLQYSTLEKAADGEELHEVILPEVKVTKDTTATLDVRKTTPVEIRTPKPAEQNAVISYQTYRELEGRSWTAGTMYFSVAKRVYVSPTAPVTEGSFEFASRWQLTAPLLEADVQGSDLALDPYYMPLSPLFGTQNRRLTVADAGSDTAPDFRPRNVRGKLAVILNDGVPDDSLAQAAAKAGARALVLVTRSDMYPWTRWEPVSTMDRLAVPTIRVSAVQGAALLKRAAQRNTVVEFSGTARSPYLYDVMQVSSGRIPQHVVHTVSDRNSARVKTTYAENGGAPWASEQRFGWRPYQDTAWNQYTRHVPTGWQRTEYVSSGDNGWQHYVHHKTSPMGVDFPLIFGMTDEPRTYRAGQATEEKWFGAVVRPSIPRGTAAPSVRSGDVLALRIPEFTDSQAGHWSRTANIGGIGLRHGAADAGGQEKDEASAVLYRNGEQVAQSDGAWGNFPVAPGKAAYRLDLTTARTSDDWTIGTRTSTSWDFRSETAADTALLPLLQLDYDVHADAHNSVKASRNTLGVTVRHQDGLPAPKGVGLKVEASYDDGRTWSGATRVSDRGRGEFTATLGRPSAGHGDVFVTLRVTATDSAGNRIQQTVERAYLLHR